MKNTLVQGTLNEIAENLLKDTKKEKNSLLISIHEVQTNIDILQKNISAYHKEQLDRSSDIFKVSLEKENLKCKIMEEKSRSDQCIIEELKKRYDQILLKEQDLLRLNEYISNSFICDSKDFLGEEVNGLKLLETQEIERKRIARELHDSTVQNLTTLIHKTELCTRLVDLDSIRVKLELQTMIGTIKTTINDMRNIIYDLRPMSLEDLGLVITVKRYIKQFIDTTMIKVILNVENERKVKSDIIDLTLFRIIQEACNNVMKHAKASIIQIDLIYQENCIELVIEDDGCGVDNTVKREEGSEVDKSLSGFGLSIMKERVGLLSGKIEITSVINKGTKISVYVPIN